LAVAAGASLQVVRSIFDHIYGQGAEFDSAEAIARFGHRIGIDDAVARLSDQRVKDGLRCNTEEAVAEGVFGVPTFVVEGEFFWGYDSTDMLQDFLKNRKLFGSAEMTRLSTMPMGRIRS
jgi:2-hydroxychromene-2-carboxylate isomerase